MSYIDEIKRFVPSNEQEENDKRVMLDYIHCFEHNVLLRENEIAHLTSSGFIMNQTLDKVLMIHHNIYGNWAWTGGHADGDGALLEVAIREAKEETGIKSVRSLSNEIASIDILYVNGHVKRGKYVSTHLHLSVAYVLICDENETLTVKPDENSGVRWFGIDELTTENFIEKDVYLYRKMVEKAKKMCNT